MEIVKNLSVDNIRGYEGFERREDLDFFNCGNYFSGFSYKGVPIITMRSGDITYMNIQVDYLDNKFTNKEWLDANGWNLCGKFNGVSEFAMDDLIETLEEVIAKVGRMNAAAEASKKSIGSLMCAVS